MDLNKMEFKKVICRTAEEFKQERLKWAGKGVIRGRTLYAYGEPVAELRCPRGGHRDGSGRKRDGEDLRVTLTVRVKPKTKERLDRLKGDLSYGKMIDKIVNHS